MSDQDWAALGERVRERRVELGLRQHDMEAVGGPSGATVRNIEQAAREKYSLRTFAQLERALQWEAGTAMRIINGDAAPDKGCDMTTGGAGPTVDDWKRLADAVAVRRARLGLNQEALAARGGPSGRTVRDIENGRVDRFTPATLSKLDRALDWRDGISEKILDGTATESDTDGARDAVCACVVNSPAWIERELATERRINAIAQVFQGEMQRLLALVSAARELNERQ